MLSELPNGIFQHLVNYTSLCTSCAKGFCFSFHFLLDLSFYADCMEVLEVNALPYPILDLGVPPTDVNSYAVDFFVHKSLPTIIRENHLTDNHAYRLIHTFNKYVLHILLFLLLIIAIVF